MMYIVGNDDILEVDFSLSARPDKEYFIGIKVPGISKYVQLTGNAR